MTSAGAASAVKISALVTGGAYAFRRFTEGTPEELKASRTLPPLGRFIIAWATLYAFLSIAVEPAPALAGWMAILVLVAVLLAQGNEVFKDLNFALEREKPKGAGGKRSGKRRGASVSPVPPTFIDPGKLNTQETIT